MPHARNAWEKRATKKGKKNPPSSNLKPHTAVILLAHRNDTCVLRRGEMAHILSCDAIFMLSKTICKRKEKCTSFLLKKKIQEKGIEERKRGRNKPSFFGTSISPPPP
jgi:hypothetical protein